MNRAFAFAGLLLAGCGLARPTTKYVQTGQFTSLPKPARNVEVYFDLVPSRPARVLGVVFVDGCSLSRPPEYGCVEQFKDKGGDVGADAIVGIHRVRQGLYQGSAIVWDESGVPLKPPDSVQVR